MQFRPALFKGHLLMSLESPGRWRECRERQAKGTVPCPGARQWVAGDMWARSLKHGRQEPGLGRRSTSRDAGFTMDPVWI